MANRVPPYEASSVIVGTCSLVLLLTASAVQAAPFACTGEAFVVQDASAQLTQIDQSVSPFTFLPIGGRAGFEINALGFRRTDGLLYGFHRNPAGAREIVTIDDTGAVTGLGLGAGGLPGTIEFNAGDVSDDGATMYLNSAGTGALWSVSLPGLGTASSVTISGGTGRVADWAFNRADSLLYGGDDADGELAILDPTTGIRTDVPVAGCAVIGPSCSASSLPTGGGFGAAWFDAAGSLFLFENIGNIFEIADVTTAPVIVSTQTGPSSAFNDGAACVQDVIGAAKQMTTSDGSMAPATITITYVFEAFTGTVENLSAVEDLTAVFGIHGIDWTFTSISSSANIVHNAGFNGHSDTELIEQTASSEQDLAVGSPATVTVTLTLLTNAGDTDMDGVFCNQILVTGTVGGITFGDVSTNGTDPDPAPTDDGSPDERAPSCIMQVPVELMTFSIE